MDEQEIEKLGRRLESGVPLLGAALRRRACRRLAEEASPDAIPHLIRGLESRDPVVADTAETALRSLRDPGSVDALCAIWAKDRDERLGEIIASQGYVARSPMEVRVLSALKANAPATAGESGEAVPHLVAARRDHDAGIVECAERALRSLSDPGAIDALCALWAEKRGPKLGDLIAEHGYVATKPPELRILTALKSGKRLTLDERPEAAAICVALIRDPDEPLAKRARQTLANLKPGPAQDALCDLAIQDPTGVAGKLCVQTGKRPSDHERTCLFLFVTRQLDAYFEEDFEFQSLRLQYDRADAKIRGHVMEVVRSGDRRCAGFFGTRSKPLTECNEREITLALESWLRHQEWGPLFHACLELPLKYSLAALEPLSTSGWEPEAPELQSVFRQILADGEGPFGRTENHAEAPSCVFEQWLEQGRQGDLAGKESEAKLLKALESASPVDGVAVVAALAAKAKSGSPAAQTVAQSPHWLVRLAGHATGLCGEMGAAVSDDGNYWVRELAGGAGVLECWPGQATPADLEALDAAPAEASAGKLGAARKVLKTILGHRITTGVFEEMVVEVGEDAAEFVDATEE